MNLTTADQSAVFADAWVSYQEEIIRALRLPASLLGCTDELTPARGMSAPAYPGKPAPTGPVALELQRIAERVKATDFGPVNRLLAAACEPGSSECDLAQGSEWSGPHACK